MMMMMRDIPWVPHIGVVGADACAAGAAGYQAWTLDTIQISKNHQT